jgi:extracellular elastinolytic metalloproteinase
LGVSGTLGAVISNGDLARKQYHSGVSRSFGPEVPYREYTTPTYQQRQKDYSSFTITDNAEDIALAFAEAELTSSEYIVKSAYKSDLSGVTHVYLRQKVNGLEVLNGDININVDHFGQVISYGDSFAKGVAKIQQNQGVTLLNVSIYKQIVFPLHIVTSLIYTESSKRISIGFKLFCSSRVYSSTTRTRVSSR